MTDLHSNEFVNEVTLNLLISKTQLQKLNKMRQNEDTIKDNVIYNKDKISDLFDKLLNNNQPDDLLEDVKSSFDIFIEKSIYYLEIHDKNLNIQKERDGNIVTLENINDELNEVDKLNDLDELNEVDDFQDFQDFEFENEEYFEEPKEPIIKANKKYSKQSFVKNGVDDIQKLPLDWFNTTRQAYKINQIIPRKKEIIINNTSSTNIF
jgi:hypothetical protein